MKSVLISIRPKFCEKICHEIGKEAGKPIYEKRIEVRKTTSKEVPFKAYIYETKESKKRYLDDRFNSFIDKSHYTYMGKVIGEFICDKVDKYTFSHYEAEYRVTHVAQEAMCLNQPELIRYGKGETLYGWHISELKIYDKPKELSEFKTGCKGCKEKDTYGKRPLTRPPQSWQYVEELWIKN